jgi:hypothetical protein
MTHVVRLSIDIHKLCSNSKHPRGEPGVADLIADVLANASRSIRHDGFNPHDGMPMQTHASGVGETVGWMEHEDPSWAAERPAVFMVKIDLPLAGWETKSEHLCTVLNGLVDHFKRFDSGDVPAPWQIKDKTGEVLLFVPQTSLSRLTAKTPRLLAFEGHLTRETQQELSLTVHAANKEDAEQQLRHAAGDSANWTQIHHYIPAIRNISDGREIALTSLEREGVDGQISITLRRTVVQEITVQFDAKTTAEEARSKVDGVLADGNPDALAGLSEDASWSAVQTEDAQVVDIQQDGDSILDGQDDDAVSDGLKLTS